MSVINPSINISIGNYGKESINSFHNYFLKNESEFINYSSFYECSIKNDSINFNSLNNCSRTKQLNIDVNKSREDLFQKLNDNDNIEFLKNCIYNAYSEIVNLRDQLNSSINFQIVNINFILSSFEDDTTTLFYRLIEQINELSLSGTINQISVKLFTVLSKNKDLLSSNEQVVTYQNLEEIKTIQLRFNNILHNVIFIDNQNTNAISLKMNEDSLGFVLNEFITYLMTNHYKMISNLPNAHFIALGLGTLMFDEKYFSVFFKKKMINQIVSNEQIIYDDLIISDEEVDMIKANYEELRDGLFNCFLKEQTIDYISLIKEIETAINPSQNKFTLLEYKFLLANLIGKHETIKFQRPYKNIESISLLDIIFKILNNFNQISVDKNINILELKKRLDEEEDIKIEISKLTEQEKKNVQERIKELDLELENLELVIKSKSEQGISLEDLNEEKSNIKDEIKSLSKTIKNSNYENEELKRFKKRYDEINTLNKKQSKIVNDNLVKFKEYKSNPKISIEIKQSIKANIQEQIKNEEETKNEKKKKLESKSFFAKLFTSKLKDELNFIDDNISILSNKINILDEEFDKTVSKTNRLFQFFENLEELYEQVTSSIEIIKKQKKEIDELYSNSKLLDYLFVKNVIDKQKLEDYYTQNQNDFKTNCSSLLNKIHTLSHSNTKLKQKNNDFSDYLDSILQNQVKSIIKFNIVEYMNGKYDYLELLKKQNLSSVVSDLLKMSKPFFNSDTAFNNNNSHRLMLHNISVNNNLEIENLHSSLNSCFPSTIPQQIETNNVNKFSIIEIDVIKDLSNIVKYNESKKEYNKLNSDTIIIK